LKARFWKRLLKIAGISLLVLFGLVFLVSRIDHSEPLTPEQNQLKPGATEISSVRDVDSAAFADYFEKHALPPVDYVVEKFRTHDVVLLGEAHQVREDCDLICRLIEPIYRRAGVKILAMELVKEKRNAEISRLLTAPVYDQARVMDIFREDYFYWGFDGYQDILKAVWAFNRTLAPGEAPFRVVGFQPDMNIYDVDCGSIWRKVAQFPRSLRIEELYARPIMTEALDQNQKALVQVGCFHSFPHYRQPKVIEGKMYGEFTHRRMGRILFDKYGPRVFQIMLHIRNEGADHYTDPPTTPVTCLLEKLYRDHGAVPVGFDIVDSPLAMLRDTSGFFFEYQKRTTLSDLAQGYVISAPFADLHTTGWIKGFVTPVNFQHLRTYALLRHLMTAEEGTTPSNLDQKFSDLQSHGIRFR
jgi:hypothetical protein